MRKLFFVGFIFLLIVSCEKKDNPKEDVLNNERIESLIPLKNENYWVYEDNIYGIARSGGAIIYPNMIELRDTDTSTVYINEITIDKLKGYYLNYGDAYENNELWNSILGNDEDGNIVLHIFFENKHYRTSILYKKEPKLNESWLYEEVVYSYDSEDNVDEILLEENKMYCTAVDTLIITPAGDFYCNIYTSYQELLESGQYGHTFNYYISKGIGIIKDEHYEFHEDIDENLLFTSSELIEYYIEK